jgi:hypothetical protein
VADVDNDLASLVFTAEYPTALVSTVEFEKQAAQVTAVVKLVKDRNGQGAVVIQVSDGTATASSAFPLTVTPVDDPPVVAPIADVTTPEDVEATVNVSVTDIDTDAAKLVFTGASPNPTLISRVTLAPKGYEATATISLVANATGKAPVTISVSDGTTKVDTTFQVTVEAVNDAPVLSPIADQTTYQNTPISVPLVVTDVDNVLSQLTFTGVGADPAIVSGVTFSVSGSQVSANVALVKDASGETTVTINVSDGAATDTETFKLTVKLDPPKITSITLIAGTPRKVRIEWTGGGVIQASTSLNGPWVDQIGATSPVEVAVDLSQQNVYARIKR